MERLTIVLAATAMCLALGCEKRPGQAEEADKYKADIDGPTCALTAGVDENLLADQKKISRQAELDAESAEIEVKAAGEDTGGEDSTPAPKTSPTPSPAPAGGAEHEG